MPLTTGVWKANINGSELDLSLQPPDQSGVFTGNLLNVDFRGFWDETSQTITFAITFNFVGANSIVGLFKGHLFRTPVNPAPGLDVAAFLAGTMEVSGPPSGPIGVAEPSSRRNVFGWFARITEIV